MEYRNIGSLRVSLAGLGCNNFGWRIDKAATKAVVDAALDAGINFFDTADMYGLGQSEEFLAEALGNRRKDIVLATKFGHNMGEGKRGAQPAYIRAACEDSLRRLRTDHIDLYQLHKPDDSTPIADTLAALDELVQAGKVREIGCSNFSVAQLQSAAQAVNDGAAQAENNGAARFVSVQNHYSLFHREPEAEVLPECEKTGMAFIPFFPLANGLLSGKYRQGQPLPDASRAKDEWGPKMFTEQNLEKVEKLISWSADHGHTLLDLAVSWLAGKTAVASVIAGARSVEQVKTNAAAGNWKLTPGQLAEIDSLLR